MNVKDLEGNISNWSLLGKIKNNRTNKSSLHTRANKLILSIYPTLQILQEVGINPYRNETLFIDFYIPLLKKAIEVHGEQHYKFVAHYHSNALGFMKHKKRDLDKKDWCEINNIQYIELPFNESDDEWKTRIQNI